MITVEQLAFVADFETPNFNFKNKFYMKNNTSTNKENGNDATCLLADSFLPTLDKKNFRQWMLGMMMQELDVPFEDMPKLLKLQKCTQEIIRFAEEHHLLAKNLR